MNTVLKPSHMLITAVVFFGIGYYVGKNKKR